MVLGLIAATVPACGSSGEPAEDAGAQLEAQRTEVRGAALELGPALAAAVGGKVRFMAGGWEGCNIVEQYLHRNFRYSVQGRIDAGGLGPTSVAALAAALEEQGFTATDEGDLGDGRLGFRGTRNGITAGGTLREGSEFLLFGLDGPCVDVPAGERQEWEERRDPERDLVPAGGTDAR